MVITPGLWEVGNLNAKDFPTAYLQNILKRNAASPAEVKTMDLLFLTSLDNLSNDVTKEPRLE